MNDDDRQRLREVFEGNPLVACVWLFGSHARGTAKLGSDVDVALEPSREGGELIAPYPGGPSVSRLRSQRLGLLSALVEAGFENVDLVILDPGDPVVRFEALRHQDVIYQAPNFDAAQAFVRALREFDDTEKLRRGSERALRERVLSVDA